MKHLLVTLQLWGKLNGGNQSIDNAGGNGRASWNPKNSNPLIPDAATSGHIPCH